MIGKKEWSVNINPSSSVEANFLNLFNVPMLFNGYRRDVAFEQSR